jgi:uncharacterized protein (TIGR00255 family)
MTGFGRAEGRSDEWRVEIECRSVNRKRLDIRVHLPGDLNRLEPVIRKRVKERVGRGKVDVYVDFDFLPGGEGEGGQLFDVDRFNAVCRELQSLSERSATGPVGLDDILTFHEFFEREQPFEVDEEDEVLRATLDEAVDGLVGSRDEEGDGIQRDLLTHLETLSEDLETYEERAPEAIEEMRQRIGERVRQALEEFDGPEPKEDRLASEIVYYADKADVSEELQRAVSHVDNLRDLIAGSDAAEPVGKQLDFYLQELVRETNTLSSKSNTSALTDAAVSMKSTVEKMREQVANVE